MLDLFQVVSQHTLDAEAFSSKIISFLMTEFEKVKLSSSVTAAEKMQMLELASVCSNVLDTNPDACASAIIELLLSSKD